MKESDVVPRKDVLRFITHEHGHLPPCELSPVDRIEIVKQFNVIVEVATFETAFPDLTVLFEKMREVGVLDGLELGLGRLRKRWLCNW